MTNDTAVFDAVRLNIRTGSEVWTGRIGTPEAIRRDGLLIGGELRYCPHECWRVYYGDINAGMISQCVGNPGAAPKWQWNCGFYPGSRPGECTNRAAATDVR